MHFVILSGKYLPTQNIQVAVASETSIINKCVNPKNYNLHLVGRGNLKHFRRSSCAKNSFECQDVSVPLSTFVRPGYGLKVWVVFTHTWRHSVIGLPPRTKSVKI